MSRDVLIVNYGLGNLFSVQRAVEYCGATSVRISSSAEELATADKLILPGVGAFGDGMRSLNSLNLHSSIKNHVALGKPILGICLGMQLLATSSQEFGNHTGLDIIPGEVTMIPTECDDGKRRKLPFIGWTCLSISINKATDESILRSLEPDQALYFLHSYQFVPAVKTDLIATYSYNGAVITAAVQRDKVYGVQFHPEKSGVVGLKIIDNFLSI